jgi:hypothetical protein
VLLVIFGAGASFDSVPHIPPPSPASGSQNNFSPTVQAQARGLYEDFRPPLANQLFDNRPTFVDAMQRFGDFRPLVPLLRSGTPVEQQLAKFEEQAKTFPERHRQLAAICYYLHFVLWECQKQWFDHHKGITCYATLLDAIERWRFEVGQQVCLVTFNYDTMLEQAIEQVLGCRFNDFPQYTSHKYYKLIKLHGSIDWGREVEAPIKPNNPIDVINGAASLQLSNRFRKVVRHPMIFDDGTVGYPALAIPVEKKSIFACPQEHVRTLAELIPGVTKIITIGWRATEQHFLDMLRSRLTGLVDDVDLMIVSGDRKGMTETHAHLKIGEQGSERKRALRDTGFSDLVKNIGHLEGFLK